MVQLLQEVATATPADTVAKCDDDDDASEDNDDDAIGDDADDNENNNDDDHKADNEDAPAQRHLIPSLHRHRYPSYPIMISENPALEATIIII